MSIREREKGNEYFRVFENDEALSCYCKSIIYDESNDKSFANRAAVFIRQSNFDLAIDDCIRALEINPLYVKALARRAVCYHKIGSFKEAVSDFEACREMDTNARYDKLLERSKKNLEDCEANGNGDGTPIGSNDDDDSDVIGELFTPGALDSEQSPFINITPQKSSGISPTWHKLSIIETEITDVDDDKSEKSVSCCTTKSD